MKKILALILVCSALLGFAGCGQTEPGPALDSPQSTESLQPPAASEDPG